MEVLMYLKKDFIYYTVRYVSSFVKKNVDDSLQIFGNLDTDLQTNMQNHHKYTYLGVNAYSPGRLVT